MELPGHTFFPDPGARGENRTFTFNMRGYYGLFFAEFLIYVKFANLRELNLNAN